MDIATRLRAKLKLDSDESLVDMFDDILLAFNSRLQDSAYLEEQMLQMAVHFEKTRKRYVDFLIGYPFLKTPLIGWEHHLVSI